VESALLATFLVHGYYATRVYHNRRGTVLKYDNRRDDDSQFRTSGKKSELVYGWDVFS